MKSRYLLQFLILGIATADQAQELPSFDVASVKVAASAINAGWLRRTEHGRYSYTNFTFAELLREAYGVKRYQITGPQWIGSPDQKYSIDATCPSDTSLETGKLMLQKLLADRFGLTMHREKRELPVYSLVAGKDGIQLKPTKTKTPGGFSQGSNFAGHIRGILTMKSLADMLTTDLDRPVLDETQIEGLFDVSLNWVPESQLNNSSPPGASIFQAIQEQAGLRLVGKKAIIDLLVIDRVDRIPTEN